VLARHVVGRGQQLARRLSPQHELRLLAGGLGALQKVRRVALAGAKLCEDPHVLERVPVRREPVLHGARVQRQPHGLGLILHLSGLCDVGGCATTSDSRTQVGEVNTRNAVRDR